VFTEIYLLNNMGGSPEANKIKQFFIYEKPSAINFLRKVQSKTFW